MDLKTEKTFYLRIMRYIPAVLIVVTFVVVCVGGVLMYHGDPNGKWIMLCGFAAQGVFINLNRFRYRWEQKRAQQN